MSYVFLSIGFQRGSMFCWYWIVVGSTCFKVLNSSGFLIWSDDSVDIVRACPSLVVFCNSDDSVDTLP